MSAEARIYKRRFHVIRLTKRADSRGRWGVAERTDHWLSGCLDLVLVPNQDRHSSEVGAKRAADALESENR